MSFINEDEFTIYIVWNRAVGGDYFNRAYIRLSEAEQKKEQREKHYDKVWIQKVVIKKEKEDKTNVPK